MSELLTENLRSASAAPAAVDHSIAAGSTTQRQATAVNGAYMPGSIAETDVDDYLNVIAVLMTASNGNDDSNSDDDLEC